MTHEPLIAYIEAKSMLTLTEADKELVNTAFKMKHLRKRQYLLQEGDVCKNMAFIVQGAGRMYALKDNGQENIIRLAVEGWWLGDYESYNLDTPSIYCIDMTEDSDVLLVSRKDMVELTKAVPAVDLMVRAIDRNGAIATQKRVHAAISLDAGERYEQLANTYPYLISRFPQNMIASYLGISPETLSRVRNSQWQK